MNPRVVLIAVALDWLLGDPPNAFHPVAWLGKFIGALETRAPRDAARPRVEFFYGVGIVASGVAVAVLPAVVLEKFLRKRGALGALLLAAFLKTTFAWRALIRAGAAVRGDLETGDLDAARANLRALVSRDPMPLDASRVAAATIESLAENASDSFVAPLFYYTLFGLAGASAYRAVNTLDAMIGYRGRYEYLGKFAARLDDALNFIPARATAGCILLAARCARAHPRRALKIFRRDRARTASPNAGAPMSAMAGALDVRLEKVGQYTLNAEGRGPRADDIRRAATMASLAMGIALTASLFVEMMRKR